MGKARATTGFPEQKCTVIDLIVASGQFRCYNYSNVLWYVWVDRESLYEIGTLGQVGISPL
jgi:hypothetical protein